MIDNKFSFALKVQNINKSSSKVLVVACSVGIINSDGWFKGKDVRDMFMRLKIPKPSNVYRDLGTLSELGLLIKKAKKWSLTPKGKVRVNEILETIDINKIELEANYNLGSFFGHAFHSTIPPDFSPPKWQKGISQLLEKYPFETNVFMMTRFPADEDDQEYLDPLRDTIEVTKDVLSEYGLTLHLASDRQIDDDLLGNVAAHMWACNYGIGIFEDRLDRGLNYNVVTEVGAMLMTGRRCALIKDTTAPEMPTDIAGMIYKPTDLAKLDQVKNNIEDWVINDLSLGA